MLTSVKGLVRGYRIRRVRYNLIRVCVCLKLMRVSTRVGVSQEEYKCNNYKGVYTVGVSQEVCTL